MDLRERWTAFIHGLQDEICEALERIDGSGEFREDLWNRPGGGGGKTRVLEEGAVFEKGGVNTSVVYGELDEAFAKQLPGEGREFWAAGISLVLHPRSPLVPTVHANFRMLFHGSRAWIGGGADLTPWYLFDEDVRHFHRTLKAACDRHGEDRYPRFKRWCDEYFFIRHRQEARGVGGVFFDNLEGDLEREAAFAMDVGHAFLPAYLPIVERRKGLDYTPEERAWQEIRRGRYVEFNLVYDRGTAFGLETQGRTESILMSLPPRVRWVYDHHPAPGSEEARLVEVLKVPRDWAAE
ncbi:MAG: oxygen-dependent coproporphyrinogen oxidase [Myxococcaceae bacterium]|nr:oxygen-dependent coproporphyrinogen oxidase [Myxococcaceae bacterium]